MKFTLTQADVLNLNEQKLLRTIDKQTIHLTHALVFCVVFHHAYRAFPEILHLFLSWLFRRLAISSTHRKFTLLLVQLPC